MNCWDLPSGPVAETVLPGQGPGSVSGPGTRSPKPQRPGAPKKMSTKYLERKRVNSTYTGTTYQIALSHNYLEGKGFLIAGTQIKTQ